MSDSNLSDVSKNAFDAALCSLAGYFVVHALDPRRWIPTVRRSGRAG
jgi:hypothetical protein